MEADDINDYKLGRYRSTIKGLIELAETLRNEIAEKNDIIASMEEQERSLAQKNEKLEARLKRLNKKMDL